MPGKTGDAEDRVEHFFHAGAANADRHRSVDLRSQHQIQAVVIRNHSQHRFQLRTGGDERDQTVLTPQVDILGRWLCRKRHQNRLAGDLLDRAVGRTQTRARGCRISSTRRRSQLQMDVLARVSKVPASKVRGGRASALPQGATARLRSG